MADPESMGIQTTNAKSAKAPFAPQRLEDQMLDQAVGGSDLAVWHQNYGTAPPATGNGGGPNVKVFDGRGG